MKILKLIVLGILSMIGILILFIGSMYLIGVAQGKLLLPKDYIMWVFKYPFSSLVFVYEFYFIFGFFYALSNNFRMYIRAKKGFIRKHKMSFLLTFTAFNIIMLYTILYDVTVITNNKILNYSFLSPQGKEYSYNNIVKIDTGVYGEKLHLPLAHYSRGDFYYVIQLNDGTKINLTDEGGMTVSNDTNPYANDIRFILEKLDSHFVNMGIPKVSSMDNFEYCTKNLDKIYTDKIRTILLNIKR